MRGSFLRLGVFVGAGVLVVHESRYVLAPLPHPAAVDERHAYLGLATPLVGLLVATAVARLSLHLVRRVRSPRRSPRDLLVLWLIAWLALLAVYAGHELAEEMLGAGHLGGLASVLGHSGWVIVAFALLVGVGVVALLRGAETALARHSSQELIPRLLPPPGVWRSQDVHTAGGRLIGRHLAGRAPPRQRFA